MRVLVTGGTGFIGRHLVEALAARGDEPVVVTRDRSRAGGLGGAVVVVEGDPTEGGAWQEAVAGSDAVVHLAGAPVDGRRWDARYKQVLHASRIDSARKVIEAIAAAPAERRPRALISASGIDYYPFADDLAEDPAYLEDSWVDESAPRSDRFLGRLCRDWEAEALAAGELGLRVACMRTGMVLGAEGPLARLVTPFKWFAGGRIGSGRQWVSWIHIEDAVRGYLHVLAAEVAGPVNLVGPSPVRNRDFAAAVGKALGRPSWLPVPGFALRLAVGELAEHILGGRRVEPKALRDSGFEFHYPELGPALEDLL